MIITHSPTQKLCCTCEFWIGPRELNSGRTQVKADAKDKFKCIETKSTDKRAGYSCGKWEKWGAFKG